MFIPTRHHAFASFVRHARLALTTCAVLLALGATGAAQDTDAARRPAPFVEFTIDVAEDGSRAVPILVSPADTQPERGATYVTEGRLFPAGTITGDGAAFDPRQTGHIGVWFARGTHLVASSEIPAASLWAVTTQLFLIGRQGKELITSEGVEGSGTRTRVVTGGAGNYAGVLGEQRVTFLGFNATGGANYRVTFMLRMPAQ